MRYFPNLLFATVALAALSGGATAEEQHCKLIPKWDLVLDSYDIVGAEACKAACVETEGCTAWSYAPNTFRPKDGPGWCRGMEEVGEQEENDRDYCGRL